MIYYSSLCSFPSVVIVSPTLICCTWVSICLHLPCLRLTVVLLLLLLPVLYFLRALCVSAKHFPLSNFFCFLEPLSVLDFASPLYGFVFTPAINKSLISTCSGCESAFGSDIRPRLNIFTHVKNWPCPRVCVVSCAVLAAGEKPVITHNGTLWDLCCPGH